MNDKRELVNTNSILQNPRVNISAYATPKMASSKLTAPFADSYKFGTAEKKSMPQTHGRAQVPQYLNTLNGVQ
jgi:hypothetical protein